jgi:PIN domain nuclease of toxin-antitoxin system
MTVVLDTHTWLWWVNLDYPRLKPEWIRHIELNRPGFSGDSIS